MSAGSTPLSDGARAESTDTASAFSPRGITRPHPRLMQHYVIVSLFAGPFFPLVLIPLYLKYVTLRYEFDDRGISMRWGALFRRETLLTYRRIQDIHLTRGIIERWLGLSKLSIQTASGASGAEMTLEGILETEALRDYLYRKMRGVRGSDDQSVPHPSGDAAAAFDARDRSTDDEVLGLLTEIRDALSRLATNREARP